MKHPLDTPVKAERADSPALLIQTFQENGGILHQCSRQQFWNQQLPFYTTIDEEAGISRKEYANGQTELVRRHMDDRGNFTDEVITTPALPEKYL